MKKRAVIIMNPVSGMKIGKRYLADIIYLFTCHDYETLCLMTQARGDGEKLAFTHAAQADLVVCIGGDGTFTEVASGVVRSGAETPIGYIPAGSTNDFANSLHLPHDLMQAAKAIIFGDPHKYDMCLFGKRYFSYIASFGAFTRASYSAPQNLKNLFGHAAYILEGIRELSTVRAEHVRIELDDGRILEEDYLFGGICNSTSVGGVLSLDPKRVDMNDGLFEMLLVKSPHSTLELTECVRALREQNYDSPMLTLCSVPHVRVWPPHPMDWSLDGEHIRLEESVDIYNVRDAITIVK